MCRQATPFLALTGTADEQTRKTTCKELVLKNCTSLFVSPNRKNLRISVKKLKKDEMLQNLNWLVSVLSYAPFDKNIASLQTAHDCCSFCAAKCNCGGTQCISEAKPFEVQCTPQPLVPVRTVSESQKRF